MPAMTEDAAQAIAWTRVDRAHRDTEFAVAKERPNRCEQQQQRRDDRHLAGANADSADADDVAADAQIQSMWIGVPDEIDR
jgi:hypothetical protein